MEVDRRTVLKTLAVGLACGAASAGKLVEATPPSRSPGWQFDIHTAADEVEALRNFIVSTGYGTGMFKFLPKPMVVQLNRGPGDWHLDYDRALQEVPMPYLQSLLRESDWTHKDSAVAAVAGELWRRCRPSFVYQAGDGELDYRVQNTTAFDRMASCRAMHVVTPRFFMDAFDAGPHVVGRMLCDACGIADEMVRKLRIDFGSFVGKSGVEGDVWTSRLFWWAQREGYIVKAYCYVTCGGAVYTAASKFAPADLEDRRRDHAHWHSVPLELLPDRLDWQDAMGRWHGR